MPALGDLTGKQAAALAGLAPISTQSENWQGKASRAVAQVSGAQSISQRLLQHASIQT
jgi:hypothetical protein